MKKQSYQPHKKKRARKFGFLERIKTSSGKAILKRRRQKGRQRLTVV